MIFVMFFEVSGEEWKWAEVRWKKPGHEPITGKAGRVAQGAYYTTLSFL